MPWSASFHRARRVGLWGLVALVAVSANAWCMTRHWCKCGHLAHAQLSDVPSRIDYLWLGGFSLLVLVSWFQRWRGRALLSGLLVLTTLASMTAGGVWPIVAPLWLAVTILAAFRFE
jgi:hypothetical protein